MTKDWLTKKITIEKALEDSKIKNANGEYEPDENLKTLISKMEEGDELWEYSSPLHSWKNLVGRGGYAIVRNGEVIKYYNNVMS
ncbi:MAG TPA: hypothetical protein DIS94_09280 [Bacteroidetes bacterium]|nr:hypothetical protein [Bacteroidota bacterium]